MKKINCYLSIVIFLASLFIGCAPSGSFLRRPDVKGSQGNNNKSRDRSESFNWGSTSDDAPYELSDSDEGSYQKKRLSRRKKVTAKKKRYSPSRTRAVYGYKKQTNVVNYRRRKKPQYHKQKAKSVSRGKKRYRVRRGDTLYSISRRYKLSLARLCSANRLNKRSKIKTGSCLIIPGARRSLAQGSKRARRRKPSVGRRKKHKKTVRKVANRYKPKPKFIWPVTGIKKVTQDKTNGVKSLGILITGKPGASVLSSAAGTVQKVGFMRGFGNFIMISHKNRYITVYSNLDMVNVAEGDMVIPGKSIGRLDNRRNSLHFQINRAGKNRNPLPLLPKKRT
jgi:septal ring factor EnvC (AmiA/AmiB activator)